QPERDAAPELHGARGIDLGARQLHPALRTDEALRRRQTHREHLRDHQALLGVRRVPQRGPGDRELCRDQVALTPRPVGGSWGVQRKQIRTIAVLALKGGFFGDRETDELQKAIMDEAASGNRRLVLDMKDCQSLNSIAIGVIMRGYANY